MSKPKPAVRTVKRRGLAIATAVAVTSSTFATVNFAYAEETTESGQDVNIADELTTETVTPNTEADETTVAVSPETTHETVRAASEEEDGLNAPTVEEAFLQEEASIKTYLIETQDPEATTVKVAEKFRNRIDGAKFGSFEFQLRKKIKSYFNELVAAGDVKFEEEGYSLPSAKEYFDARQSLIAADLRLEDGSPNKTVDEVVAGHVAALSETHKLGDDDAKTQWETEFRQLVQEFEKEIFADWYKPSVQQYYEQWEPAIEAGFRSPEPQSGAAAANKILAEAERANFEFNDDEEKTQWENEFRKLVLAKEAKILAELKQDVLEKLEVSTVNDRQKEIFKKDLEPVTDLGDFTKIRRAVDAEIKNPVAPFGREDAPKPEVPAVEDEAGVDEAPESPLVGQVLETAKKQAWSYVHESEYLSPDEKAKFQNDIQAAGDLKSVEDAYAEVIQAESEIHLADSKSAAVAAIEGSQFLTDAQKASYVGAVKAASSVRQVEGLVDAALDAADLQQESAEAGAHRAVLNNELGVNSNPVVDPNKQQLIAEDLAAPFAKHRDEVAEREAAEDLVEAKRAAKAAIDGAQHLSDAQKVAYKGAVDAASSVEQVESLVYGALDGAEQAEDYAKIQEQFGLNETPAFSPNEKVWTPEDFLNSFHQNAANEAAKKLEETKSAATADVAGAVRLTENQKSEFKDRIGAAKTVEEVKAVLDEAHKLVDKLASEDEDKATLEKEKQEAHRIIDGLTKLSLEKKAAFKKQVDDANTGAYVAHVVERAQEMNAQQNPSGDGAGAQEPGKPGNNETPGKPGNDNKPGKDQKPGSTTDAFKGFFGLAAGLGVFALIFGGILHSINHFDGFGVVQEHVRNAFAKIGIRF